METYNLESFVALLTSQGYTSTTDSNGYRCQCPGHGGENKNLTLSEADDGRILMTCQSKGCSFAEICKAVDVEQSQLMGAQSGERSSQAKSFKMGGKPVAANQRKEKPASKIPVPPGATLNGKPARKHFNDYANSKDGDTYEFEQHSKRVSSDPDGPLSEQVTTPVRMIHWAGKWQRTEPTLQEAVIAKFPRFRSPDLVTLNTPKDSTDVDVAVCRWDLTTEEQAARKSNKTKLTLQFVKTSMGWICAHKKTVLLYNITQPATLDGEKIEPSSDCANHRAAISENPIDNVRDAGGTPIDSTVYVVEGEKKMETLLSAGGLMVTSWPGGSSNAKKVDCSPLNGRPICFLADNDEPGIKAMKAFHKRATELCPDSKIRGGLMTEIQYENWKPVEGDDIHDFVKHVHKTHEATDPDAKNWAIRNTVKHLPDALSTEPLVLKNYRIEVGEPNKKGEAVEEKIPLSAKAIYAKLLTKTNGINRITKRVFVHTDEENIKWIESADDLFAYVDDVCNAPSDFANFSGMLTKKEFYHSLKMFAPEYDTVSLTPTYPLMAGSFYAHRPYQIITNGTPRLDEFLAFFRPLTNEDHTLMKSMLLTLFSGVKPGNRPMFFIGSPDRNAGKTTMVDFFASLAGGYIDYDRGSTIERIRTRFLSTQGRLKRVATLDNMKSDAKFSYASLESLVTRPTISGHDMYFGEGARPNDITWIVTSNDPNLSRDFATRGIFIEIDMPARRDNWALEVQSFIDSNRWEIIGEIIGLLQGDSSQFQGNTRTDTWDSHVLKKLPGAEAALELIHVRQHEHDSDTGEQSEFEDFIDEQLHLLGYADYKSLLIPRAVGVHWYNQFFDGPRAKTNTVTRYIKKIADSATENRLDDIKLRTGRFYVWKKDPEHSPDCHGLLQKVEETLRDAGRRLK